MRFFLRPLLCTAWLSVLLLGSSGQTQFTGSYTGALGSTWNNPTSALLSQMILNDINRRALQASLQKNSGSQGVTSSKPSSYQYPLSKTDFKFKGKPTQQKACASMTDHPADQQQLAKLCLSLFQQIEANPDFRKHNLATALAFLLGASWQVSEQQEFSDDRLSALQRTLNDQLVSGSALQKLGAQDVQKLYESGVMIGGLLLALNEQTDQPSRDLARALAQAMLHSFGLK